MNIFVVDFDPKKAARDLCDKHVVKMVTESAQLLSTWAHHQNKFDSNSLFKATHINHPCNIWLRQSNANVAWLIVHALEMSYEYTRRYHKIHKSQSVIDYVAKNVEFNNFEQHTDFVLCMPDQYKQSCPVKSYRSFYKGDKASFAKWKHSETPDWWY